MASPEEILCTACGLCCDGTLFADVELTGRRELEKVEAMGLEGEDEPQNASVLVQPCAALKNRNCSVYNFRPKCCRTFECRILKRVKNGSLSTASARNQIADTLKRITRVKELLAPFSDAKDDSASTLREQCQAAIEIAANGKSSGLARLEAEVESLDAILRTRFLE
jgi:uncharacterized protein